MKILRLCFKVLRNKYFLAFIAFGVWILFIDERDVVSQMQRKTELKELLASMRFYETEIEKAKKELNDLQTNASALEKLARENFKMRKADEDVFLVQ